MTDESNAERGALQALLERIGTTAPEGLSDVAVALARAAYRRVDAEALLRQDAGAAAQRIVHGARFLAEQDPGEFRLAVAEAPDWTSSPTVIDVASTDSPFLLSTLTEALEGAGYKPATLLHPVFGAIRDDQGRLTSVRPARTAERRESWIHVELERALDDADRSTLASRLHSVLADAKRATGDLAAMRARLEELAFDVRATAGVRYDPVDVDEVIDLLQWLGRERFVFLGYREYDLVDRDEGDRAVSVRPGTGLGILADESTSSYASPVPLERLSPSLRPRVEDGGLLVVARTNRSSTVHRRERMIYIGVKKVHGDGRIAGEHRFVGLFSRAAYADAAGSIPVLRRKLRTILEREDVIDGSYDERALRALFEAFPLHELFSSDLAELHRAVVELYRVQRRQDVRLLCRADEHRRSVAAVVTMPRERFSPPTRERLQTLLCERFAATRVDYHLSLTENEQALLHFVLHAEPGARLADPPAEELQREVATLARTWQDRLQEALADAGADDPDRLAQAWGAALPVGYTDAVSPVEAVADVLELDALDSASDGVRLRLSAGADGVAGPGGARVKLYKTGEGVELSSFMPILESLGFVVVEEVPHRLESDRGRWHIHDFGVRASGMDDRMLQAGATVLAEAVLAVWRGQAEADSLNRLVLTAGLRWEDVAVLRAYRRYRRQLGTAFTEAYQNNALCEHPDVAKALVALFAARFDPDAAEGDEETARAGVLEALESIERLDQDRILRGYLGLVEATMRTNHYRLPRREWLSLKLDSAAVPHMGKPVPHAEVFVYAPAMEGVHLRGGPVARGGLRHSDRQEDFRVEVLGLMKAQMTKNAVIVPTGSKGGFVLKRPPHDGEALRDEVRRQYERFIRGLLDITDNVVDGQTVVPHRVRRADGDDPYLVVAADRGTATFSDLANEISAEYGFWLGDAFASGGSKGYDHKAMGITARGAWVAVQRHFRELDIDIQTEPVRVVGIGDMSGDVFGNALLRSRCVKLVAAFDHRDIFLDPEPDDAAASYAERARLAGLGRSSWQDYDRALISEGGGVWSRTVKSIPLSSQAREMLRVKDEAMSPPALIQAILRAPADLLFAGGIGTFVKAADEAHSDVGDRVNEAIRVDARELGARVVGEGGNLAMTQRARIQYSRRGGRCNTDAIDNVAGVDTSDREVNLKILLRLAVDAGRLEAADRDALLAEMTEDVAEAVLRDVYLQTWAVSHEVSESPGGMDGYEQFMEALEAAGRLDREIEALPDPDEMAHRVSAGAGMTRPELAVLVGYAKVDLRARLLDSSAPDDPALRPLLTAYFPEAVRERFDDLVDQHRLRRELVATLLANEIVNRMGVTWASRTSLELGCQAAELARAWWIARQVAGAEDTYGAIERLDGTVDARAQLELKAEVDGILDAYARAYVREALADTAAAIERDRPAFLELAEVVAADGPRQTPRLEHAGALTASGVDTHLTTWVAGLAALALVPDVAAVARDAGQPVDHVADVFFALSDALPLERLHAQLHQMEPRRHWQRWQHHGLVGELRQIRREGAHRALAAYPDVEASRAVAAYLAERSAARQRAETLVGMLESEEEPSLDAVAVAVRSLRDILAGPAQS